MIEAKLSCLDERDGRRRHIGCVARSTKLVGDHADRFAVSSQAQDLLREIVAFPAAAFESIETARANDEMFRADGPDKILTGQLTRAVDG